MPGAPHTPLIVARQGAHHLSRPHSWGGDHMVPLFLLGASQDQHPRPVVSEWICQEPGP